MPDDRYERGGERDLGGKKKRNTGPASTQLNAHRDSLTLTWPVEGQ